MFQTLSDTILPYIQTYMNHILLHQVVESVNRMWRTNVERVVQNTMSPLHISLGSSVSSNVHRKHVLTLHKNFEHVSMSSSSYCPLGLVVNKDNISPPPRKRDIIASRCGHPRS